MRTSQLLTWGLIGFAVYEVIAWKVNESRMKGSVNNPAGVALLPFDLLGRFVGYPGAGLGPYTPATRVTSPSLVNSSVNNTFNAADFPGVAAAPLPDPNNLLNLGGFGRAH